MSRPAPTSDEARKTSEPPPTSELQALLWVLVALLAALELTWWFFERMYSA